MDEIHYWAEMQSELKNGFAEMGSALAKLIRAAEARNVPPLLEAVSLQVTPQRINRRGYTFAYLLVSEETLKALGTSLITLQMGTFVAQVQAGVGLVQLPLVEDGYISVPGLTGSWDALVYLTNEQAPSVTPLGSTTTSPLITELTGQNVPYADGTLPWNTAPTVSAAASEILLTATDISLAASANYSTSIIASPNSQNISLGVIVSAGGLANEGLIWSDVLSGDHQWSQNFSSGSDAINSTGVIAPYVQGTVTNGSTAQTLFDLQLFSAGGI